MGRVVLELSRCFPTTAEEKVNEWRAMDIGGPTDVQHVAHVTFDRFNGFLGLPSEFEPDVPKKAPSARFLKLLSFVLLAFNENRDSKNENMDLKFSFRKKDECINKFDILEDFI